LKCLSLYIFNLNSSLSVLFLGATIAKFEETNMEDGLQLDMECDGHPRPLEKYIEAWRIQLWEHVFLGFFKDKESY
jgi:hypothetical protein